MKLALMLLVVLVIIWLWRSSRLPENKKNPRDQKAQGRLEEMVSCNHCGIHFPLEDAHKTHSGHYCCVDHRDKSKN